MAGENVGLAIRHQRQRLGLSQGAVAEKAHIQRAHLTRIESGRWIPRLSTLERLADALETTVESLLGFQPKAKKRPAA